MGDERQEREAPLTARELEILRLIGAGLTNQQIAERLFVTLDTVKWHNQQAFQKLHVRNRIQAIARARELGLTEGEPPPSFGRHHHLPTQTTQFIGREAELAEIQRMMAEPGCRLLTLVGPGGIGKTRLALAAASQVLDNFADGVCFVPLATVSEVQLLVAAMAEALNVTFYGKAKPEDQLLKHLHDRQLLLVLDNFEHLLEGTSLLAEILSRAPEVRLIVTSRELLHLQEEWRIAVQGLPYPVLGKAASTPKMDPGAAEYGAVRLFLTRAHQADANFLPSAEDLVDIVRICQLVDGMPLGLELAAGWIRSLSCHEIASEIQRSVDFLTTSLRNLPKRHRSLRAVIEQTWQRLLPQEQAVLCQLSVFRGGCNRQAAQMVTHATLSDLSSLIDKALLRRTDTGRYELHELIRQFAEEQLLADRDASQHTQQRHMDFFITFLEQRTAAVKGARQTASLAEISTDLDNVRLAWQRAAAQQNAQAVERAAECLFVYFLYGNGYGGGSSVFGLAVTAFADTTNLSDDDGWQQMGSFSQRRDLLVAYLQAAQGYFLAHRYDLQAGQFLLEGALSLLSRSQASPQGERQRIEAFARLWLGWAFYFQGRIAEGQRCAGESLAHFAEIADPWAEGWSLLLLGNCAKDGRPAEAERAYRQGLAICQESGDETVLSYLSFNLGTVIKDLGHYAQAQTYIDNALRICEKQQNILGLGYALFYKGQLEIDLGKYEQAIQTIEHSLSYFNDVGTVHASRARVYLGIALHLKGEHSPAQQAFTQALEGFQVADSRLGLAQCLNGFGCLAYNLGDLLQAEKYHREALALWQELAMEAGMAATLHRLGRVRMALDKLDDKVATQYFRQALEITLRHQLAPIALAICVDVATSRMPMGDARQVSELLKLAEQHESSTHETRMSALQVLARGIYESSPSTQQKGQSDNLWAAVQGLLADDCSSSEQRGRI